MKDKLALAWLYHNSKSQSISLIILTVCNMLYAGCGVLFAIASRGAIDSAVAGETDILLIRSLGLFFMIILHSILRIISRNFEVRIQGRLEMLYKAKLIDKIMKTEYRYASKYHSGELMNRLTSDISVISEGVATILPDLIGLTTKLLSAIVVLCVYNLNFAIVFTVGGFLLAVTASYFREKLKSLHKSVQEKDGITRSFLHEVLESLIVIKIFAAESSILDKAVKLQNQHFEAKIKKNTVSILANAGFSYVFSLGYLFAMVWSAFGLVTKTISFGTLTAVLQLVGQVQSPISGISGMFPKIYGLFASTERMMELEDLPEELEINQQDIDLVDIYDNMVCISFEDVSFQYERDIVLNQLNITIAKGEFVVISGRSGIGKSTLIKLLLGVYVPTNRVINIRLNNHDKISADRYLRKLFAYVPQGNQLFSGSIRENITFGNKNASDKDIMAAVTMSCLDFIHELPQGLDTMIGEKGQGLSEGQGQRIAIARAILCEAPILVLDEVTSALDETTEERILKNLIAIPNKTCIMISHKKAALALCSKEILLEGTSVKTIERGHIIEYHYA